MTRIIQELDSRESVEKKEISSLLRKIATEYNLKVNEMMRLMRSSLTGLKVCFFKVVYIQLYKTLGPHQS